MPKKSEEQRFTAILRKIRANKVGTTLMTSPFEGPLDIGDVEALTEVLVAQ